MLFLVVALFAAIDSAAVVGGVNLVSQIAQGVAAGQGNQQAVNIISIVSGALIALFSFVWGHRHGKAGK